MDESLAERFSVVLEHAESPLALLATRLCARVRARAATIGPELAVPVTVSIGVATLAGETDTSEDLLGRADAALYRAKAEGRDRVCAA